VLSVAVGARRSGVDVTRTNAVARRGDANARAQKGRMRPLNVRPRSTLDDSSRFPVKELGGASFPIASCARTPLGPVAVPVAQSRVARLCAS